MDRWPITRKWAVFAAGTRNYVQTADLAQYNGCALLGAAGLGKTFEIDHLADVERRAGWEVRKGRLADLAQSADLLPIRLEALAANATPSTAIYLDALDEIMVPIRQAGRIVAAWLRDSVQHSGARIRISCRSAVFPESVHQAIEDVYGSAHSAYASLQSLDDEDIDAIVASHGLDVSTFRKGLSRSVAFSLAEQPLTLEMLLRVFRSGGELPASRVELFDRGMRLLVTERVERREEGTAIDIPVADLLDASERLACFTLLSGRELVDYGDAPDETVLSAHDLAGLPGGTRRLDTEILRALRRTALFEREGVHRFRFAHRQFPEYLAGKRLSGLLPHQSRPLLASPLGWQAGVAGPLRETAAFAAIANSRLASWIAETDPEVVGASDISDETLRKSATTKLLDKLQRHELTDAQLWREGLELKGLQYSGAEQDLAPLLQQRGAGCEDVLEGAIKMIEAWELSTLSNELADVVLDKSAPLGVRQSAGYALMKFGTLGSRERIKNLASGSDDDPNEDLKGIALRCNYPDNMTIPELLSVLSPPRRPLYGGAYSGFIHTLDLERFDASGHRVRGLEWALQTIRGNPTADSLSISRVAKRIARAAVDELTDPAVANSLSVLLFTAGRLYANSPLAPVKSRLISDGNSSDEDPITSKPDDVRRRLYALIVRDAKDPKDVWWLTHQPADILSPIDLEWLLERACDNSLSVHERLVYVELARHVPWDDEARCVAVWLRFRDREPAKSRIPFPLFIDLQSEAAEWERGEHARSKNKHSNTFSNDQLVEHKLHDVLARAEAQDPRYFIAVANLLTVSPSEPDRYEFERFLTRTERWKATDEPTRARIIAAAKQILTTETEEAKVAKDEPLNSIRNGYMQAVWLLLELDPAWLESQSSGWWNRWSWYFLRELRPHLSDEEDLPKRGLLQMLFAHVPSVEVALGDLAGVNDPTSSSLLGGIFDLCSTVEAARLDQVLSDRMLQGTISASNIGVVAQFILSRDSDRALQACLAQLAGSAPTDPDTTSVTAAVALLSEAPSASWTAVSSYLRARPDLAPRVLGEYARNEQFRRRESSGANAESSARAFSFKQAGELASFLLELYPIESDPVHDGAYWVGPNEAARDLRNRLINWLSQQRDLEALEALRLIEHCFGGKYPWLRRPRASAERAYRLSRWVPVPVQSVASILAADDKRLIRSNEDAVDAVVAAIEDYAYRLRHSTPNDLEDLWNRPRKGQPTPKEEERISDKISAAIREYFQAFAVTADREVQVFRRLVPRESGGLPGSEVDVLCRIPATSTTEGDAIAIPVEVKLAHNPEARTGMKAQLAARYMNELGTDSGVYVVAWMDAPNMPALYKPTWDDLASAKSELKDQALALKGEGLNVREIVLDASLGSLVKSTHRGSSGARNERRSARTTNVNRRGKKATPRSKRARRGRTASKKP